MRAIETATLRKVLKHEKKTLRLCRSKDFEDNRARSSAATEDALSRVLMLEELLDGSAVGLSHEDTSAPGDNNTLDL